MQIEKDNVNIEPYVQIKAKDILTTKNSYNDDDCIIIDNTAHSSFSCQFVNYDIANDLSYKVESSFDGENWDLIKEANIVATGNEGYSDSCKGTMIRISVKSKLADTPAKCKMFIRLNPFA